MAVASLLLLFAMFRPGRGEAPSRERLGVQLAVLGPMRRQELALTAILLLTLSGWLAAPQLQLDLGTVALLGLLGATLTGAFSKASFRELDWGFLLFYGVAISLAGVAGRLGVDRLAVQLVTTGLERVGSGPLVFLLGVAVLGTVIQLLLPKNTAILLLGLAVVPVAPAAGIDPWVAVVALLATSSFWILPTQTASYLVAYSASEGRLFSHQQARPVAYGYAALTLIGIVVCTPYWHALGLI
jgi:DASS family divalent anion:Na+ symporter